MKKALLMLIVIVVFASSASALEFKIGPKFAVGDYSYRGSDWSTIKDSSGTKDLISPSFAGGVFVNLQFIDLIGIQVEGLFTHATFKYGDDANWNNDMFNAISVPVYARANFDLGGFGLYLLAGPRFDLLLDNYISKDENGTKTEGSLADDGYQNFYVGLGIGAGVMVPAGPGSLDIGLAYSTTFTKVDDAGVMDLYMQGIEVQVAYGFGF